MRKQNFSPKFRSYSTRDEIDRKREKKILAPNSIHTRPWQENSEKNSKKIWKIKNLFPAIFQVKQDGIGRERENKNLDPNSVPTQPELENSKKNSKKIQKIQKLNSDIMSIQNGLREAEKEWKKF